MNIITHKTVANHPTRYIIFRCNTALELLSPETSATTEQQW
jgi:hypothetical protein